MRLTLAIFVLAVVFAGGNSLLVKPYSHWPFCRPTNCPFTVAQHLFCIAVKLMLLFRTVSAQREYSRHENIYIHVCRMISLKWYEVYSRRSISRIRAHSNSHTIQRYTCKSPKIIGHIGHYIKWQNRNNKTKSSSQNSSRIPKFVG